MGNTTGIEWTDATWNPVSGCSKVSQGCKHCYAERDWKRLAHLPAYLGRAFTDVACHSERLDQPLRWRRPRRIFVNSMSDLFHEDVPDDFIDQVFAAMALAPQHTFQVLTKRPERMLKHPIFTHSESCLWVGVRQAAEKLFGKDPGPLNNALPNVWLGVSVEDQNTADERIPLLLQTPAAVRWISAEPLLGDLDLRRWVYDREKEIRAAMNGPMALNRYQAEGIPSPLDWVVVGGESGPHARPMHSDWARSLRDQCAAAGVSFLFKQWGEWIDANQDECPIGPPLSRWVWADGAQFSSQDGQRGLPLFCRAGKKIAGRLLDGVQHDEYPSQKTGP